jgi:hypothetical protein
LTRFPPHSSSHPPSCGALQTLKPDNKDKEILLPLSESLYVPGKMANTERVLVDIGTGYYIEKVRAVETPPQFGRVPKASSKEAHKIDGASFFLHAPVLDPLSLFKKQRAL